MIRAQIQFDEAVYARLRRLAHRERISIAEAVRRLVAVGLGGGPADEAPRGAAALLALAGIGASGVPDLGRRHDDYLEQDGAP